MPIRNCREAAGGLPGEWIERADALRNSPDDHGRFALTQFAQRLNLLYARDQAWTERVVIASIDREGQAIVGAVSTQRAEGGVADERGNQADGAIDARAIGFAPVRGDVWRDACIEALPEGRGDGQEALTG